jgi:ribosomal protein S18 acetylase RimI-like enzyme
MDMIGYAIRRMERSDLDFAMELAASEGWNPGLHDADCFYQTDPNGFFVGLLKGQPIGCISAVSYSGVFGFMGLYIVVPEYRGQGYGFRLWNTAMDYLKNHNNGLDGVVEQQANYRKSGFKLEYRNIRFEGIVSRQPPDSADIVALSAIPLDHVCTYDRRCFPVNRERFLRCWMNMPESKAVAFVEGDTLAGYGVVRKCRRGYKVGPLFANNRKIAEALFRSLMNRIEDGSPIFLDVPEVNLPAVALAESFNMERVFETARMYSLEPPKIAVDCIFGVTTFELG